MVYEKENILRAMIYFNLIPNAADVKCLRSFCHDYGSLCSGIFWPWNSECGKICKDSPEGWYEDANVLSTLFAREKRFHTVAAFGLSMGYYGDKLATKHLVEYAGTFVRQYLLGNPRCQAVFQVFMMYAKASYKCRTTI